VFARGARVTLQFHKNAPAKGGGGRGASGSAQSRWRLLAVGFGSYRAKQGDSMSNQNSDAKALRPAEKLANAHNWKHLARWNGEGFYELSTEDTGQVRVRLFFTPQLLESTEEILYRKSL
jgi:hypothetical protein